MTVAEEFAHSLLHEKAIKNIRSIKDFTALHNHPDWHKHERNAKRLAAALLMPSENILNDSRTLYKELVAITGCDSSETIKKYLANILAEKYEVSLYAMKIRLSEWPIKVMDKIDQALQNKLDFFLD